VRRRSRLWDENPGAGKCRYTLSRPTPARSAIFVMEVPLGADLLVERDRGADDPLPGLFLALGARREFSSRRLVPGPRFPSAPATATTRPSRGRGAREVCESGILGGSRHPRPARLLAASIAFHILNVSVLLLS
jgi:hypothetical protein